MNSLELSLAVRLAAGVGVMYESIVLRANRLLLCFPTTKSIREDDVCDQAHILFKKCT